MLRLLSLFWILVEHHFCLASAFVRGCKRQFAVYNIHNESHLQLACSRLAMHGTLKLDVVIAIERHARLQILRHSEREEAVVLHAVYAEALQLLLAVEEAQTVAVGEHSRTRHVERPSTNLLYISHILAHSLRRVERRDVLLSSVEEVVRESAVECLLKRRCERIATLSERRTAEFVAMLRDVGIERLAISSHHVLHVVSILQSTLNLQRADTRFEQIAQSVELAHILKRKQIAVLDESLAVAILQVERHAAELRALASVGATVEEILRCIASARIAHAQCAMHERLKLHIGMHLVYVRNLLQREFTSQYHTLESVLL